MPVSTAGVTSFQHHQNSEGTTVSATPTTTTATTVVVVGTTSGSDLPSPPRAKRCKHCDESNHRSDPGSGYWHLQLDQDLIDTISSIYPEWFIKDNNNTMTEGGGSGGGGGGNGKGRLSLPPQVSSSSAASPFSTTPSSLSSSTPTLRHSPPKAIIDTSPILIDQNKESLKVKLLLRRPFDQLVAQGIMPPHGQRKSLDRAKTGDILKAKIQQRPPRQELERRHILEVDALHADPSLAERQRMLRKARLADQLNDQLSHRPGPLELIQKNILHTEEPIEQAVKTGKIPYKATSEGALKRPQHPHNYINPEEDSQGSSEGDSQSQIISSSSTSPPPPPPPPLPTSGIKQSGAATVRDVLETAAKSAGIMVSLIQPSTTVLLKAATPTTLLNKDSNSNSSCSSTSSTSNDLLFTDLCRSVAAAAAAAAATTGSGNGSLLASTQCGGGSIIATASSPAASLISSTSTLSPLSSVASPIPSIVSQPATPCAVAPPPPPPPLPPLCSSSNTNNSKLIHSSGCSNSGKSDAPGKDKNRKKSKSKAAPKTRTIKFHEYKGPPSAQKSNNSNNNISIANGNGGETRYDLLLQQQTLLMQLELQHKYPQILLPAQQKPNTNTTNNNASNNNSGIIINQNTNNNSNNNIINRNIQPISNNNNNNNNNESAISITSSNKITGRLEDMKVSDLKMELKRRNLPVSGSKPQLIERLKPFTIINQQHQQQQPSSTSDAIMNINPASVESVVSTNSSIPLDQSSSQDIDSTQEFMDIASPATPAVVVTLPASSTTSPPTTTTLIIPKQQQQHHLQDQRSSNSNIIQENNLTKTNEDIVREQQRQIEELQRELTLSQLKLQALGGENTNQSRNNAASVTTTTTSGTINGSSNSNTTSSGSGSIIGIKQEPAMLSAQLLLQKHLQAKQQQQQAQNLALQMDQLRELQAKQSQINVEQQRLQQQQHVAFQNQKNLNANSNSGNGGGGGGGGGLITLSDGVQKNLRNAIMTTNSNVPQPPPPLVYHLIQEQQQQQHALSGGVNKAGVSRPNYITSNLIAAAAAAAAAASAGTMQPSSTINEIKAESPHNIKINLNGLYPDEMKLLNANHIKKHNGKSQIVDDLLEILIKNGELPPSAASYPSTPGSAEVKNQQHELFYPNVIIERALQPSSTTTIADDIDDGDDDGRDGGGGGGGGGQSSSQEMLMMMDANSPDAMALAGIDPAELLDTMGDLQEYMDINQFIDFNENGQNNYPNAIEMDENQHDDDIAMDTEELLEAFMSSNVVNNNQHQSHPHYHTVNDDTPMIFTATVSANHHNDSTLNYDPLLGSSSQDNHDDDDTFDLFNNLDVFRSPADLTSSTASWDVV